MASNNQIMSEAAPGGHRMMEKSTDHPLQNIQSNAESNIDVVEITQGNPYFEPNFIGTYLAVCLGALSSYGGFVMPATSLALINADIGMTCPSFRLCRFFCLCRQRLGVKSNVITFSMTTRVWLQATSDHQPG